jgi:hypothetical protein
MKNKKIAHHKSRSESSIEQTRAHLQKQLRQKEADCNRMAVQVRVSNQTSSHFNRVVSLL